MYLTPIKIDDQVALTLMREGRLGLVIQFAEDLASKDGRSISEEFKKFHRKQPCWIGDEKTTEKSERTKSPPIQGQLTEERHVLIPSQMVPESWLP